MHTDFAVITGSHHAVTPCQDYCLSGQQGDRGWAAVADGCSTGGRTDLGARAWALAAEAVLKDAAGELLGADELRSAICANAEPMLRNLQPEDGLATLITLQVDGPSIRVCMFGDGAVVTKRQDGQLRLHNRVDAGNAPFYLNYLLHPTVLERYRKQYGGLASTVASHEFDQDGQLIRVSAGDYDADQPFELTLHAQRDELECVLISTDGIGTGAGLFAAVRELAAIKGSKGEFLKRRMNRLVRDWQKAGTMPTDDLAVAGVWVGYEETSHV